MNVKNWLIKVNVTKDLFGILVILNLNVINQNIGEYLDYKHCKCRNKSVDKLVEDCSKNIDGNEMIYND